MGADDQNPDIPKGFAYRPAASDFNPIPLEGDLASPPPEVPDRAVILSYVSKVDALLKKEHGGAISEAALQLLDEGLGLRNRCNEAADTLAQLETREMLTRNAKTTFKILRSEIEKKSRAPVEPLISKLWHSAMQRINNDVKDTYLINILLGDMDKLVVQVLGDDSVELKAAFENWLMDEIKCGKLLNENVAALTAQAQEERHGKAHEAFEPYTKLQFAVDELVKKLKKTIAGPDSNTPELLQQKALSFAGSHISAENIGLFKRYFPAVTTVSNAGASAWRQVNLDRVIVDRYNTLLTGLMARPSGELKYLLDGAVADKDGAFHLDHSTAAKVKKIAGAKARELLKEELEKVYVSVAKYAIGQEEGKPAMAGFRRYNIPVDSELVELLKKSETVQAKSLVGQRVDALLNKALGESGKRSNSR